MNTHSSWTRGNSECAQAWRQPRWRLQLLPAPRSWVHATPPGIVPAAMKRVAAALVGPALVAPAVNGY
jgi:hypothetical protein